jgi:hypothetical protein
MVAAVCTIATIRQDGGVMACKGCHSEKQNVFNGEIAIHFRGFDGLDQPIVWVFQKTVVCLQCGFTEFTVPERELQVLEQGSPVDGAVVLWPRERPQYQEKVRIKSPSLEIN